jgi:hypothetical protein
LNIAYERYQRIRRRIKGLPDWDGRWRDIKDVSDVMKLALESCIIRQPCLDLWLESVGQTVPHQDLLEFGIGYINRVGWLLGNAVAGYDPAYVAVQRQEDLSRALADASRALRLLTEKGNGDRHILYLGGPRVRKMLDPIFAVPFRFTWVTERDLRSIIEYSCSMNVGSRVGPVGYLQAFYPHIYIDNKELELEGLFSRDGQKLTGCLLPNARHQVPGLVVSARGLRRTRIGRKARDLSQVARKLDLTPYQTRNAIQARLSELNYALV